MLSNDDSFDDCSDVSEATTIGKQECDWPLEKFSTMSWCGRSRSNKIDQSRLHAAVQKFEISPEHLQRLKKLIDYEIVMVCDDSGSMNTPMTDNSKTRWMYLCEIVKTILEFAMIFDSNGVDIHFLNNDPVLNVQSLTHVDKIFASIQPSGYTPLVPVLKEIFQLPPSRLGHDKKLLVLIATDGAPTDAHDNENILELERLMCEYRKIETTFVNFLVCTEDPFYVQYLCGWDRSMTHVDVTNHFSIEKVHVLEYHPEMTSFSLSDYVVKALVGSIDPETDDWNEPGIEKE